MTEPAKEEPKVYFSDVYERLSARFDKYHERSAFQGGPKLTYITGEQATSRLNEVLGMAGWSFRILEHGYNPDADEIWVLGELVANCGGSLLTRQQFGSQKVGRKRDESIIEIGFDLKGAATDALKKCASLIGVGLSLYDKDELAEIAAESHGPSPAEQQAKQQTARALKDNEQRNAAPSTGSRAGGSPVAAQDAPTCEQCGEELKEVRFRDGTTWTPALLANYGRNKHGKVLCMQHYREANEARKKAEMTVPSMDEVPF